MKIKAQMQTKVVVLTLPEGEEWPQMGHESEMIDALHCQLLDLLGPIGAVGIDGPLVNGVVVITFCQPRLSDKALEEVSAAAAEVVVLTATLTNFIGKQVQLA